MPKIDISFTANVTVEGGKITVDELTEAIDEWLNSEGDSWGDSLADYIPEEIEFDHVNMVTENIRVK